MAGFFKDFFESFLKGFAGAFLELFFRGFFKVFSSGLFMKFSVLKQKSCGMPFFQYHSYHFLRQEVFATQIPI